jgi:hypothetical protein
MTAPHQERVVAEERELSEKLDRLVAFIGGDVFRSLDDHDQELLQRQADAMRAYADILGQRIARF